MGLETLLPYLAPIIASNVKGVATWVGSKKGKGQAFNKRKAVRTLVSGIVTMIIARVLGMEPTDANLAQVTLEFGFIITFVDVLFMKYAFKKLGLA